MAKLYIPITEEEADRLALDENRIEGLIRDYLEYLLAGGTPVTAEHADFPTSEDIALIAVRGGSFDWLDEEPDIYTLDDGEPV